MFQNVINNGGKSNEPVIMSFIQIASVQLIDCQVHTPQALPIGRAKKVPPKEFC